MPKKSKPKLSMWERIREGMRTIGEMAESMSNRNKKPKKPPVDTGRVSPRPVKPQPSPEQEEYLRRQRGK